VRVVPEIGARGATTVGVVVEDSTLRDVRPASAGPTRRWPRRFGIAVLTALVVAGALGVFGVHSSTVSTSSDGYTLTVTYPRVARAGLDVPWRASVHHPGGLPKSFTIAISTDYFRMFETQGFYPNADSMTNDGRFVYFTFMNPQGADFVLDYDAYIQPASQLGKSATVEVIVGNEVVARTSVHTWLVP